MPLIRSKKRFFGESATTLLKEPSSHSSRNFQSEIDLENVNDRHQPRPKPRHQFNPDGANNNYSKSPRKPSFYKFGTHTSVKKIGSTTKTQGSGRSFISTIKRVGASKSFVSPSENFKQDKQSSLDKLNRPKISHVSPPSHLQQNLSGRQTYHSFRSVPAISS